MIHLALAIAWLSLGVASTVIVYEYRSLRRSHLSRKDLMAVIASFQPFIEASTPPPPH